MSEYLKPCPFCGSDRAVICWDYIADGGVAWWVSCPGCHVRTEKWVLRHKVIALWNRRSETEKPLPCPWCDKESLRVAKMGIRSFRIECVCYASGPICIGESDEEAKRLAVYAWNRVARKVAR